MGNGAKAAMKRDKNATEKKGPTSQLKANASAMNIQCVTCKQTFMSTTKAAALTEHADSKHKGKSLAECFPTFTGDKTK